jgi:2-polyprenyl-3-methyl-5-hydroxy-6-metoxy-1,4-benzoquinol methylase
MFRQCDASQATISLSYKNMALDALDESPRRRDFDLVVQAIEKQCRKGRILDVGCFRGDLLASLPAEYDKFGIEPSDAARETASRRGIKLIGYSLEETAIQEPAFDVIT